jgi:hypothetical protein
MKTDRQKCSFTHLLFSIHLVDKIVFFSLNTALNVCKLLFYDNLRVNFFTSYSTNYHR